MQKVTAVLTKSNSHSWILIFKSCSFKQVTISTTIKCGGSPHTALLSTNKAPAKLSRLPADLVGQYCLGSHCTSPLAQSGMHIHLITSKGPQPFQWTLLCLLWLNSVLKKLLLKYGKALFYMQPAYHQWQRKKEKDQEDCVGETANRMKKLQRKNENILLFWISEQCCEELRHQLFLLCWEPQAVITHMPVESWLSVQTWHSIRV